MIEAAKARINRLIEHGALRLLRNQRLARKAAVFGMSTPAALARIAARGLEVQTVLDVGASDGRWSLETARIWPQARYLLVEANRIHAPELAALCATRPQFQHALVAAGPSDGEIRFDDRNPFGGRANPDDGLDHPVVDQRSLASLATEHALPPPYLIKLDTHGYEVPILDGAAPLFARTSLLVIEAYTFPIRDHSPRFFELCTYMDAQGFAAIDMSEPMWRPRDGALWQFDLFFVAKDRPEFAHRQFR